MKKNAFTIIELLIVIAIIGILASMLLPALKSARDSAKLSVCSNNLKQAYIAMEMYRSDYNNYIPFLRGATSDGEDGYRDWGIWPVLLQDALNLKPYYNGAVGNKSSSVIKCPSSGSTSWGRPDYATSINFANKKFSEIIKPEQKAWLLDHKPGLVHYNPWMNQLYLLETDSFGAHLRHSLKSNHIYFDGHIKPLKADEITTSYASYKYN